jgi:Xaa-Pro dipeptidase
VNSAANEISEKQWRYARLREEMAKREIAGLLAYAPAWRRENVRYLTNAPLRSKYSFAYLPIEGEATAFVLSPEDEAAVIRAGFTQDVRPLSLPGAGEVRARLADDIGRGRIAIAHRELLPHGMWTALTDGLPIDGFESATGLMDRVRLVKSDWELARIRKSGQACDVAWQRFLATLHPGVAEYEIVAEVEAGLAEQGAEDNFMLIASGGSDVRGMTSPTDRRLCKGDMVRTEVTPQMDGYWAQICRSAVVGPPSDNQRKSFDLFEEAVQAGIDALRPGVTAGEVAAAENDVFRRYGYGEYCTAEYTRVRGHCLGLHLDEVPILEGIDTVLEENAVLIVHPNTFTPLAGYHVLGDPVVVTKAGAEPLLSTPRRLDWVEA